MKLTTLNIQNFGPHTDTTIVFGEGHNLIYGPNGSGKSSVLRALSWALTGTCHLTDKRGRGFERLIRDGSKEAVVELAIEPLGTIKRSRGSRKHKLMLSWSDSDKVADNEVRLLDALELPAETIWAMFDPIPILERSVEDQRAALLRVLRPPEIKVPQSLIDGGITKIAGVEHVESLLKDHKESTLRDLNRDAKWLDEHPPEPAGEEPAGVDPKERSGLLDRLNQKHAELTRDLASTLTAIGTFQDRIRRGESAGDPPSKEDIRNLDDAINMAEIRCGVARHSNLKAPNATKNQVITTAQLTAKRNTIKARIQDTTNRISELQKHPTIECPADSCPLIKQLAELAAGELEEARTTKTKLEGKLATIESRLQDSKAAEVVAEKAWQAVKDELKSAEEQRAQLLAKRELNEKHRKLQAETEAARKSLEEATEKHDRIHADLQKCEALRDKHGAAMSTYADWQRKAEAVQKWRDEVAEKAAAIDKERQIVDDLTELRKSMIGGKLEEFLAILANFLKPFGITGITYTFDGGFVCVGRAADLLSDGQKAMMFEAAFKVAVATVTGIGIVAVDDLAPMTDQFRELISESLLKSGHQVIECVVGDESRAAHGGPGECKVFFLSDEAALVSPAA